MSEKDDSAPTLTSRLAWDQWLAAALRHQASVDADNGPTAERRDANTRFASICRMVADRVLTHGTDAFDWPPTPAEKEIDAAVSRAKEEADRSWACKLAEVEAERNRLRFEREQSKVMDKIDTDEKFDAYTFLIHIDHYVHARTPEEKKVYHDHLEENLRCIEALTSKVEALTGQVEALSGKVCELQAREPTSEQQRLKDEFDARHGG